MRASVRSEAGVGERRCKQAVRRRDGGIPRSGHEQDGGGHHEGGGQRAGGAGQASSVAEGDGDHVRRTPVSNVVIVVIIVVYITLSRYINIDWRVDFIDRKWIEILH